MCVCARAERAWMHHACHVCLYLCMCVCVIYVCGVCVCVLSAQSIMSMCAHSYQKVFSLVHVTCVGLYIFSCMPNLYVSSERWMFIGTQ